MDRSISLMSPNIKSVPRLEKTLFPDPCAQTDLETFVKCEKTHLTLSAKLPPDADFEKCKTFLSLL